MKERGILFSAPMVKALLADTKSQTRRIVKDPPRHWSERLYIRDGIEAWEPSGYTKIKPSHDGLFIRGVYPIGSTEPAKPSPYGVPGDRLWVRETWGIAGTLKRDPGYVVYRASCEGDYDEVGNPVDRWRSARFMKRDDSRITLEITEVRAERLQSISEEDAKAEGVEPVVLREPGSYPDWMQPVQPGQPHRIAFAQLWDAINGERASWASNPWVWCVSFKRFTP